MFYPEKTFAVLWFPNDTRHDLLKEVVREGIRKENRLKRGLTEL